MWFDEKSQTLVTKKFLKNRNSSKYTLNKHLIWLTVCFMSSFVVHTSKNTGSTPDNQRTTLTEMTGDLAVSIDTLLWFQYKHQGSVLTASNEWNR